MVDRTLVRMGGLFGSTLALTLACSSETVPLNKAGGKQNGDVPMEAGTDAGAGGSAYGAGGGAAGSGMPDSGTGGGGGRGTNTGGTGGTPGVEGDPGPATHPVSNAPATVKTSHKLDLL